MYNPYCSCKLTLVRRTAAGPVGARDRLDRTVSAPNNVSHKPAAARVLTAPRIVARGRSESPSARWPSVRDGVCVCVPQVGRGGVERTRPESDRAAGGGPCGHHGRAAAGDLAGQSAVGHGGWGGPGVGGGSGARGQAAAHGGGWVGLDVEHWEQCE